MAEHFIESAVHSALAISDVKEILLVEDGSTDQSLSICQSLSALHPSIQLLQHDEGQNKGASASRNLGIHHANMPYIAFLDADDIYLPNRFTKDRLIFQKYPDADGVYNATGSHYLNMSASNDFKQSGLKSITTLQKSLKPEELCRSLMGITPYYGYFTMNSLTLKKESLPRLPRLFDEQLSMHEDSAFMFRLAYYLNLYPSEIDIPTCSRGIHPSNRITHNLNDKELAHLSKFHLWSTMTEWSVKANIDNDIQEHCNKMKNIYQVLTLKEPEKSAQLHQLLQTDSSYFRDIGYLRWFHFDRYGHSLFSKIWLYIRHAYFNFSLK